MILEQQPANQLLQQAHFNLWPVPPNLCPDHSPLMLQTPP